MLSVIAINILYTFLSPSISISGHLGGALGGLIAMFMIPSKNLNVPLIVRIVAWIVWALSIAHVLATTIGLAFINFF